MKPVLIVENSLSSLVRENKTNKKDYILHGTFTEFGVKNRNDRIYTPENFLPALDELNERIETLGVVYGEFDHPDVFDTSLTRVSHALRKKLQYIKESNLVYGEIKLLNTTMGKEAKALVDDECPLFVSSRAAGITEADGNVVIKKLFTYDIVADPGFSSAKMNVKILNESLGYNSNSNFRIYDLSEESKINELFDMNKNDFVTKKQLNDYYNFLIKEMASTKKQIKEELKKFNNTNLSRKTERLLEYYDRLNKTNSKVKKTLKYLTDNIQILINENKALRSKTENTIKRQNYLSDKLNNVIKEDEKKTKNLNKYLDYIADEIQEVVNENYTLKKKTENLNLRTNYATDKMNYLIEYLENNLNKKNNNVKFIKYLDYLADNMNKINEKVKSVANENKIIKKTTKKLIDYTNNEIGDNLEKLIHFSEHNAKITNENLKNHERYFDYLADNIDKSIKLQGKIIEKVNSKLNESVEEKLPTLDEYGFKKIEDDNESSLSKDCVPCGKSKKYKDNRFEYEYENDEEKDDMYLEDEYLEDDELENDDIYDENDEDLDVEDYDGSTESELSKSIDKLIEEAKKRKIEEKNDLNFLKFLNKSQIDSFYSLSKEEQEAVKLYINEKSYFSQKDVLRLISEALSTQKESLEERVIRLMPENMKPIWNQLNESVKKSILSQARLYPEEMLATEEQIEHFWLTRNLKKNEPVTKKLISEESLIQENKLSEKEIETIIEKFKRL